MTERLYYNDPFLFEFEARVVEARPHDGRQAIVLDRSAFYPESGGQLADTGTLGVGGEHTPVTVLEDAQSGEVLHIIGKELAPGTVVKGKVDVVTRLDHMQQHSGQHVLSAVFLKEFGYPTVSFHMGTESSTIDLEAHKLSAGEAAAAEAAANEIVRADCPVWIHFKSPEEAEALGVRKIPPELHDKLRLIEIQGVEYNPCGGTHVRSTGQIGAIHVRKIENVKQGVRVEFVCGGRAVGFARRDFEALTEAAGLMSTHIYDVPQQIQKLQEENKTAARREKALLQELAEYQARQLLAETPETNGWQIIRRVYADRDVNFVRLLAQKIVAAAEKQRVVVLLGSTMGQPTVILAEPIGGALDLGGLMKELMSAHGGRGGGSREMAQGGLKDPAEVESVLNEAAQKIGTIS